jgi:hypothetical protein
MRIVDRLKEITICPNCGADALLCVQNPVDMTQSKFCPNCREEIFESVQTIDSKDQDQEQEDLLIDARDLLQELPRFAKTVDELDTLIHISNIFDKILTLLEK